MNCFVTFSGYYIRSSQTMTCAEGLRYVQDLSNKWLVNELFPKNPCIERVKIVKKENPFFVTVEDYSRIPAQKVADILACKLVSKTPDQEKKCKAVSRELLSSFFKIVNKTK